MVLVLLLGVGCIEDFTDPPASGITAPYGLTLSVSNFNKHFNTGSYVYVLPYKEFKLSWSDDQSDANKQYEVYGRRIELVHCYFFGLNNSITDLDHIGGSYTTEWELIATTPNNMYNYEYPESCIISNFQFYVKAINAKAESARSVEKDYLNPDVLVNGIPSTVPTGIVLTQDLNGVYPNLSLTIEWDKIDLNNTGIDRCKIYYKKDSEPSFHELKTSSSPAFKQKGFQLTNLDVSNTYQVKIAAVNVYGQESAATAPVSIFITNIVAGP